MSSERVVKRTTREVDRLWLWLSGRQGADDAAWWEMVSIDGSGVFQKRVRSRAVRPDLDPTQRMPTLCCVLTVAKMEVEGKWQAFWYHALTKSSNRPSIQIKTQMWYHLKS